MRSLTNKQGFCVYKPENFLKPVPLFCNICNLSMSGQLDNMYYEKFKCCSSCGIKWADPNQERWRLGWRPEKVEIKEEVNRRISIPISFSF